jgi:hypothetical protein
LVNRQLGRWIAAVLTIGVIAAAVHLLSPAHETRSVRATAPAPRTVTQRATTPPAGPASVPVSAPVPAAPPAAPPSAPAARPPAQPVNFGADPSPAPPPSAPSPLPQVAIYGDSLTVLAWEHYQQITAGEIDSYEHAAPGDVLPDWRDAILADPLDHMVLALGTNDAERDGAKPWADLLNALPATTCVVWPKPYEGSNAVTLFNAQMAAVVAAHSNVHVVDWNATAQAHPEWVLPDHVHYTQEGFDHYAEMLRQSALTCGPASA